MQKAMATFWFCMGMVLMGFVTYFVLDPGNIVPLIAGGIMSGLSLIYWTFKEKK